MGVAPQSPPESPKESRVSPSHPHPRGQCRQARVAQGMVPHRSEQRGRCAPGGWQPRAGLCVVPSAGPAAAERPARPSARGGRQTPGLGGAARRECPSACRLEPVGFSEFRHRGLRPCWRPVRGPDSCCALATEIGKRPGGGGLRLPGSAPFSHPLTFLGNTCLGPPVPSWVAAWSPGPPQPRSLSLSLSSHLSVPTPCHRL